MLTCAINNTTLAFFVNNLDNIKFNDTIETKYKQVLEHK